MMTEVDTSNPGAGEILERSGHEDASSEGRKRPRVYFDISMGSTTSIADRTHNAEFVYPNNSYRPKWGRQNSIRIIQRM